MKNIIVLGSINMDLVVSADRAPEGGETLSGTQFQTISGGKGANQAVAIARQGGNAVMIARVGKDAFGDELIEMLDENDVGIEYIKKDSTTSSGIAMIVVEKNGQNRIIVVPGANGEVTPEDVDNADSLFEQSDFLVAQLEIPKETVRFAFAKAKERKLRTVLNVSPAPLLSLDKVFLRNTDYMVVNETEAQAILGMQVTDKESAFIAAKKLQKMNNGIVVLTMGNQGSVTKNSQEIWHTPAFKVDVKDTTAAGDAFIGGLVARLQIGKGLRDAVTHASAAGALAASKFGAQPSLPTLKETTSFLSDHFAIH